MQLRSRAPGSFRAPSALAGLVRKARPDFRLSLLTLAVGATAGTLPFIDISVTNPLAGVALETCAALVALLSAYLCMGRFSRRGRRTDLALAVCLTILAGNNVLFGVLPAVASMGVEDALTNWASIAAVMTGALGMMLAAWLPETEIGDRRRAAELAFGGSAAWLALLAALALAFAESIPPSITNNALGGHPVVLTMQMFCATFFAVAALGFMRRADRDNDVFLRWVEAAAILGSFACLNYFLYPVTNPHWINSGDLLRVGFYLLLTVGAAREIADYWNQLAKSAQLEERRRLARDMHDGLAQELAYIARQAQVLDHSLGPSSIIDRVHEAAKRSLSEARRAIAALADTSDQSLDVAIASEAMDIAERAGVALRLNLAQGVEVSLATRDALLRIVREAVTNAVAHGRAERVTVELRCKGNRVLLRVSDNGSGFDPAVLSGGFGLISMRERTQAVGGEFHLASAPGRGTDLEVTV